MQQLLPIFISPKGSIDRQTFWVASAVLIGTGIVLGMIPVVGALVSLALLWPWACLSVQRLRDMGRPIWIATIPLAVCGLSGVLAAATAVTAANAADLGSLLALGGLTVVISTFSMLIALLFLLWIGLAPSQRTSGHETARNAR